MFGLLCSRRPQYCTEKDTNKQADAGSRIFSNNCSSPQREGLSTHVQRECLPEPFLRSILAIGIFTSIPGSCLRIFIAMQILLQAHLVKQYQSTRTLCSKLFLTSREREGLSAHVQRECPEPLYAASCVTKDHLSPVLNLICLGKTCTNILHRTTPTNRTSEFTDVRRSTQYNDPGIEHTLCRNSLRKYRT